MAFMRKRVRRTRRRPTRSRRKRAPKRYKLRSSGSPVPNKYFCKLRYVEQVNMAINTLATTVWKWGATLQDPNQSGIGHQPLWRDELALMYTRYRVNAFSYKITVTNTIADFVWVAILPRSSFAPTGSASIFTEMERRQCQHKAVLGPVNSTQSQRTFVGYVNCAAIDGITKKAYQAEDVYSGAMSPTSTNPQRFCTLDVLNTASSSGTLLTLVQLVFYCELHAPVQISSS